MNQTSQSNNWTQDNPSTNHHEGKVFRLAPVQSPEEEAREEVLRDIAPKIRRKVREDERLSAPAKFFFDALFDDCFWHAVGGHGTGQVFADIRTLADRYRHDEKSIRAWRDELVESGWLWTNYAWPMTEWRITPLMPAPSDNKHKKAVQMALGRAASEGNPPDPSKNAHNPKQSGQVPTGNGQNSRSARDSNPPSVGTYPGERGKVGPKVVGQVPTSDGIGSHGVRARFPRATGQVPTGDGIGSHERQEASPEGQSFAANGLAQNGSGEKSPRERSKGALGGEVPPQEKAIEQEIKKWRQSLNGRFPSHLDKLRDKLRGQRRDNKAGNVRAILDRKLAMLDELLDGPLPPAQPEKPVAVKSERIAERLPTEEEILTGAEYLVSVGKADKLTDLQKKALSMKKVKK